MIEDFQYQGLWWLPTASDKGIIGTLRFSPVNAGSLELVGAFDNDVTKSKSYEIIHGATSDGKKITLFQCLETNKHLSSPGIMTSTFHVSIIFEGAHFASLHDIRFKSVYVQYSYLDEWLDITGFHTDVSDDNTLSISYKQPQSIKAKIDEDYSMQIIPTSKYDSSFMGKRYANIEQILNIKFESTSAREFYDFMHLKNRFRDFLSLAVSESAQTIYFQGELDKQQSTAADTQADNIVKIYYKTTNFPQGIKKISPFQIIFTYRDIANNLETFIVNWFAKVKTLEPVYNLYFGVIHNPNMYLDHKFLSFVQAVESYHRRTRKNDELSPEDHKNRLQTIIESVPSEHKEWLGNKLAYSNEPSLRRRLNELMDQFGVAVDGIIKDKEAFIQKIVTTRNYLTHYDVNLKEKSATGEELFKLMVQTRVLLEACLLHELGFQPDKIKGMIQRTRQYDFLKEPA